MQRTSKPLGAYLLRWFQRTPVHTFFMCPLIVIAFELVQYLLVGNYRLPRAGGTAGMDAMPERIVAAGPYGQKARSLTFHRSSVGRDVGTEP